MRDSNISSFIVQTGIFGALVFWYVPNVLHAIPMSCKSHMIVCLQCSRFTECVIYLATQYIFMLTNFFHYTFSYYLYSNRRTHKLRSIRDCNMALFCQHLTILLLHVLTYAFSLFMVYVFFIAIIYFNKFLWMCFWISFFSCGIISSLQNDSEKNACIHKYKYMHTCVCLCRNYILTVWSFLLMPNIIFFIQNVIQTWAVFV